MSTSAMRGSPVNRREAWRAVGVLVLATMGVLHAIAGITAVASTEGLDLVATPVLADYRSYGWGFIITGAMLLAAAGGAWFGMLWARILGGVLLALAFLNNLALPVGVLWSTVLMLVCLTGIYAIIARGKPAR